MELVNENKRHESDQDENQRCKCNKLICVIKDQDIEIKCNKCKRMMIIRTNGIKGVDII